MRHLTTTSPVLAGRDSSSSTKVEARVRFARAAIAAPAAFVTAAAAAAAAATRA